MGSLKHNIAVCVLTVCLLAGQRSVAQEEDLPRMAANLEMEGGVSVFQAKSLRSVLPAGLMLDLGAELSTGRDLRLRLRPQVGVRFFSRDIESNIDEQFRQIRVGGTFSYDAYFRGQTSFFPFVSVNYNWVNNYDAETVGHDSEGRPNIITSDSFIKGGGLSTAFGVKVQYQRFFVRGGYEIFNPILRERYEEEIELPEPDSGTVINVGYQRKAFDLSAFKLSVGYILF